MFAIYKYVGKCYLQPLSLFFIIAVRPKMGAEFDAKAMKLGIICAFLPFSKFLA